MNANKFQKLKAFSHFVSSPLFLFLSGLAVGFILGIFISYVCGLSVNPVFSFGVGVVTCIVGNCLYGKFKKRPQEDKLYCKTSATVDNIHVEAQLPNTTTTQAVVSEIMKSTAPSDSSHFESKQQKNEENKTK